MDRNQGRLVKFRSTGLGGGTHGPWSNRLPTALRSLRLEEIRFHLYGCPDMGSSIPAWAIAAQELESLSLVRSRLPIPCHPGCRNFHGNGSPHRGAVNRPLKLRPLLLSSAKEKRVRTNALLLTGWLANLRLHRDPGVWRPLEFRCSQQELDEGQGTLWRIYLRCKSNG
jgi:hypothetical protein